MNSLWSDAEAKRFVDRYAGKGVADPASLIEAVRLAAKLAAARHA